MTRDGDDRSERDEIIDLTSIEQTVSTFAAAYVLEIVELLDSEWHIRLSGITEQLGHPWQEEVEALHGTDAVFIFNLHSALLEKYSAEEAVAFILRGLGLARPEERIARLMNSPTEPTPHQRDFKVNERQD